MAKKSKFKCVCRVLRCLSKEVAFNACLNSVYWDHENTVEVQIGQFKPCFLHPSIYMSVFIWIAL